MLTSFRPRFKTLLEIFEASTKRYPDRPLFGTKRRGVWVWTTYREFAEKVAKIRGGLAHLGVGKGDFVAIISNNRPEWAIAAYATYGRGAVLVPMYESQSPSEWAYIIRDCGARICFVANSKIQSDLIKACISIGIKDQISHIISFEERGDGLSWSQLELKGLANPVDGLLVQPHDLACLLYTSGTTGKPKGVRLSHANLAMNVSAMHEVFPISPEDCSLSFLPWAHSFGQTCELHMLISSGAGIAIADNTKIIENLKEVKPTLLFAVPSVFNQVYAHAHRVVAESHPMKKRLFEAAMLNQFRRKQLAEVREKSGIIELKHAIFDRLVFKKIRDAFGGRLKYALSGGAALNKDVAEFIDSLGIAVYEGYGLTETSPIATANWPGARKIGSVGKPIPGVRIVIDTTVTGDPKRGEIIVYGHNVMQGYHNLPEENERAFTKDGGFRTGDIGYLDEDGFLYVTGRIKEQYKLENGKYVAPAPLEEKLKQSSYISNVMIYGENRPYNIALIVPNIEEVKRWAKLHGIHGDTHELLQHHQVRWLFRNEIERLSSDFKPYERIRDFDLIPEDFSVQNGLLTPKMSIKRDAVIEKWGRHVDRLYARLQFEAA